MPKITELNLESRHLGLVLPDEVKELSEKFDHLAEILEKSLDIDGLIGLAKEAEALECSEEGVPEALKKVLAFGQAAGFHEEKPQIAVAKDEAFCFIYEDNLGLLKELGAEITFFSPLHDPALPEGIDGLLLYGGYPELYAGELSGNVSMRQEIRTLLKNGFPCLAECGGFMYLHTTMEDMDGKAWKMADVIDGKAYKTEKLGRFGYIELSGNTEDREFLGKKAGILKAHEFHYFDSTSCGTDFHAKKPLRKRSWDCIHGTESQLFGFPHLYYYSNPALAAEFLSACVDREEEGERKTEGSDETMISLLALLAGFLLDLLIGDPHFLYHPVRLVGALISFLEKWIRKLFPKTERGEFFGGILMAVLVMAVTTAVPALLVFGASFWCVQARFVVETILCYWLLATKSLKDESMKVYDKLAAGRSSGEPSGCFHDRRTRYGSSG